MCYLVHKTPSIPAFFVAAAIHLILTTTVCLLYSNYRTPSPPILVDQKARNFVVIVVIFICIIIKLKLKLKRYLVVIKSAYKYTMDKYSINTNEFNESVGVFFFSRAHEFVSK
jgi:hypothetical protein